MDSHIKHFFSEVSDRNPSGRFYKVISLNDSPDLFWEDVCKKVPSFCKGLYELAQLDIKDRLEFTYEFWLQKMVFQPGLEERIKAFFQRLDDICILLAQKKAGEVFQVYTVYSLRDDGGFFYGAPGMTESEEAELAALFPGLILPGDYLAFLRIHNGFSKAADTGLTSSKQMGAAYRNFQQLLLEGEELVLEQGSPVDPKTLIPFYESFGMPFYQCFWSEWYPENEMGNVYFSGTTWEISDVGLEGALEDKMAFKNFNDWLLFYLEQVD